MNHLLRFIFFLLIISRFSSLLSQCNFIYSGNLCKGSTITFTGDPASTIQKFYFDGVDSTAGSRIVNYTFKSKGLKTITYVGRINGNACTSQVQLNIKDQPVISVSAKSAFTQCFEKNLFCFKDSSNTKSSVKITDAIWRINDGQLFEYKYPNIDVDKCFSFKDQRGGNIFIQLFYTDANGCSTTDTINPAGLVREKIGAYFSYTALKNPSCDSVEITSTNLSLISQQKTKTVNWEWGDGSSSNQWGPLLKKKYLLPGYFLIKLKIQSTDGCADSFTNTKTVAVFSPKMAINANADSVCVSNAIVKFNANPFPEGAAGFLWNFGEPSSAILNFNNHEKSPQHQYNTIGPVEVKLTAVHPICGTLTAFDTLKILGPVSTIENIGNRIPEYQVFQCNPVNPVPVTFQNLSTFYHNDKNILDEDSLVLENGKWNYVFNSQQQALKKKDYLTRNRSNACVVRLWDFDDIYAPKCTTDVKANENVTNNCRYSRDSLPVHYFPNWDDVFFHHWEKYQFSEGIINSSGDQVTQRQIYPSDSFVVVMDSVLVIPANKTDSLNANAYSTLFYKKYLGEKWFTGAGTRTIEYPLNINIPSGKVLYVTPVSGSQYSVNGPNQISLNPGDIIQNKNNSDSVEYLLTLNLVRDTIPMQLLKLERSRQHYLNQISQFSSNYSGTKGIDYIVDFNRFRTKYYSKIPGLFVAKLSQIDTCNSLKCGSEVRKVISTLLPNAGGQDVHLRAIKLPCLSVQKPQNNVRFILDDVIPPGSFTYMAIQSDSGCGLDFTPFYYLPSGNNGMPYLNYNVNGNPGSVYELDYSSNQLCKDNFCPTVGFIIGNGTSKSGNKPLCSDTFYYHKMVCFPKMYANFNIKGPRKNIYGQNTMCRGNSLYAFPTAENLTDPHDISQIRWALTTLNAGKTFDKKWEQTVTEEYHFNSILPDSGKNKIYNYLVIIKTKNTPENPCSNVENVFTELDRDTIVTAIISKWDTACFFEKAWSSIVPLIKKFNLDPYLISPVQFNKLIWNRKGTPGVSSSGSKGIIDTSGFGDLLNFKFVPVNNYYRITHFRDTSIRPVDSFYDKGKWQAGYAFQSEFNGYHLASLQTISDDGICDEFSAIPIICGFALSYTMPDSVAAKNVGSGLKAKFEAHYFHPDPLNFGTFDSYDYWQDPLHKPGCFARLDWSSADDDPQNPITIFGGSLYGKIIQPNLSWTDLGGGGPSDIYYKDTGVYHWRYAACDSNNCSDTISGNIIITGVSADFDLDTIVPACNVLVELFDQSVLFDPGIWYRGGCSKSYVPNDYITEKRIQWGDGAEQIFQASSPQDSLKLRGIAHLYKGRGSYTISYIVSTKLGNRDTNQKTIFIPGAKPEFKYAGTPAHDTTIYEGDSITFLNTTSNASSSADYTFFFGDGQFENTGPGVNPMHIYAKAGDYAIFLEAYDSLNFGPGVHRYCPVIFPDTPNQVAHTVHVLPFVDVREVNGLRVAIYPNPTADYLNWIGPTADYMNIYDISGRLQLSLTPSGKLDVHSLNPGVYVLKVGLEKTEICLKFVHY